MCKKLLIIVLATTWLMMPAQAGDTADESSIHALCTALLSRYPAATLQDVYKTCYQDYFGAEHLMQDTAAARMYLESELEQCAGTDMSVMPAQEPTGFRHRFTRINLSEVVSGAISADELLRLFINAAGKNNAYGNDWAAEWSQIETVALTVHPAWRNDELQAALRQAAANKQAVRHSEAFRTTYNPHYRIVESQK